MNTTEPATGGGPEQFSLCPRGTDVQECVTATAEKCV